MAYRIETTGTVGPDGSFAIDRPLDLPPGRHRVILLVEEEDSSEPSPRDWAAFVEATYGSMATIPIERERGEDYETRAPVE